MAGPLPLQPHQYTNHPPVALHCLSCNVGPTLVFQCYNCDRGYCGRCVWKHGGPDERLGIAEDESLADDVSEGMHALWWRLAQRVASETAADPSGAAHYRHRQCLD